MNIKFYACLGSGNCFKAWVALRQLNKPFEFQLIDVLAGEQKSPEFLAINPLGVVPYMETEAGNGIGESNAMLWYLTEGTHLMSEKAEERARALQWMFFEQSKLEPFISPARFFTTIAPQLGRDRGQDIAQWQENARPGLARLNAHFERSEFMLASGYSLADISVFGYTHVIDEAGLAFDRYPAIARWKASVEATPGFAPLNEMVPQRKAAA